MSQCKYVKLQHLGQIGGQGRCLQCDWRSPEYKTGATDSSAHAKETGHKVEVAKEVKYIIHPTNDK